MGHDDLVIFGRVTGALIIGALSAYLRERPEVIEFRITPTGD
jgi:hypothetical protein